MTFVSFDEAATTGPNQPQPLPGDTTRRMLAITDGQLQSTTHGQSLNANHQVLPNDRHGGDQHWVILPPGDLPGPGARSAYDVPV